MNKKLIDCQKGLAVAWSIGALLILLLLIAQTNIGNVFVSARDGDLQARAWQWFLPSIAPTFTLVVGVLANAELRPEIKKEAERRLVTAFFYRFTLYLSTVYLFLGLLILMLTTLKGSAESKIDMLEKSHFFLAPIQSLVGLSLGVFFLSPDAK